VSDPLPTLRRPLDYLRRLVTSPAYRLRTAHRGRRAGFAGTFGALVFLVWLASSLPAMLLRGPGGEWHGLFEALVLMAGRALALPAVWIACFVAGLNAFAPERRGKSFEQLVTLPLSRRELVLGRALATLAPLAPALLVVGAADIVILPLCQGFFSDGFRLAAAWYGALEGLTWISILLLVFTAAFTASLRRVYSFGRTVLLALVILLGCAAMEAAMYFGSFLLIEVTALDHYAGGDLAAVGYFLLAAAVRLVATGLLLALCARRFDRWAAD
jgi:ABC-type transport system involved in multi-copper enzyme maturation permease subunit